MGFFKYLANILEHSNLNGCFIHEDSGNKTANVVSMAFAGFYYSNGDISVNELPYNYDDYKVKIRALLISFYSGTVNEKRIRIFRRIQSKE